MFEPLRNWLQMPLVSIVIPAYNAELFIDETLKSARAQDYPSIEILIVDDGSTDRTSDILTLHAALDARIRIIRTANQGVARARNTGISAAEGEFVAFLDADDLWHPSKISDQIQALMAEEGGNKCASYALYRVIDEAGNIVHSTGNIGPSGFILTQHFARHFIGNGSSLLVPRDVALEIGGFDPWYAENDVGGCEDLDFELKVAARTRLVGVSRYLVAYRRYEGNMSSNRLRMARSMVATIRRRLSDHPSLPGYAKRYALGSAYSFAFTMLRQAGSYMEAIRAFGHLALFDPREMLRLSARFIRKMAFGPKRAEAERGGPARVTRVRFGDLSPDDPHVLAPYHLRENVVARLAELDARLWGERQQQGRTRNIAFTERARSWPKSRKVSP